MAQCAMARLRVSIVFESGARIGPGKARLLESIRKTDSISGAAREMGMSYRRAWVPSPLIGCRGRLRGNPPHSWIAKYRQVSAEFRHHYRR